jgi:hypothetical protein
VYFLGKLWLLTEGIVVKYDGKKWLSIGGFDRKYRKSFF